MSKLLNTFICAAMMIFGADTVVLAAQPKPLEIGQLAPSFELPGVDGKKYRLDDFSDAKILVVVFTCNHCPTAQAYEERIAKLHSDFKDQGLAMVAICPNDPEALQLDELAWSDVSDSLDDMKIRARERNFQFPYVYDGDSQKTALAYGAIATPHVFIFDADRKLRYQGRIDNSDIHEVTSCDARNAIEALLAGKPVPVETTRVFGCSTKWSDKRATVVDAIKRWDAEPVNLETVDAASIKQLAKGEIPLTDDGEGKSSQTKSEQTINSKLLLVYLWTASSGPSVQEMLELVTINRMYRRRGLELVTISMDPPAAKDQILKALQDAHASGKNFFFKASGKDELAESFGPQYSGSLPYTLLIAPEGEVIYRHAGPIDSLELRRTIVDYFGRTYAGRKNELATRQK